MFWLGWCADYPDAHSFLNDLFHPVRSPNYVEWENAEFAELMDLAGQSFDPEERKLLYKRAEQILTEQEVAVVPLFFDTAPVLIKPRVKNWNYTALGGQHIRDWYLEE
jgi:oligopeptide transport system substrate-binding protein